MDNFLRLQLFFLFVAWCGMGLFFSACEPTSVPNGVNNLTNRAPRNSPPQGDTTSENTVTGNATTTSVNEITWHFPDGPFGPTDVVITVPKNATSTNRMPVLIALHGQGESRKSPALGARGWVDDYDMREAFERLQSLPLSSSDFQQMITDQRLGWFNQTLKQRPYRGIIVVTPYLPDRFSAKQQRKDTKEYGQFLTEILLPQVYRELPAMGTAATTGIDGVSLGGRASILVGLTFPSHFGVVGGTQAAFSKKQARALAVEVKKARMRHPELQFRLLSSEKDGFRDATLALSHELQKRGQDHQVNIVQGNHSYEFNRGPGVFEMLLYYDRRLRNEPLQ